MTAERYNRGMRLPALLLVTILAACGGSSKPASLGNQGTGGTSAVAVALVVSGNEIWIGNEEHEKDPAAQYPGALNGLRAALAKDPPARAFGAGSQGVVVTYGTGAAIRMPLGPLEQLGPDTLGKQADYRSKLGSDLVLGVQLALAELEKSSAPRRILVVIGDGNDTNNEAAAPVLAEIQKSTKTEIHALVYKSAVSADTNVVKALDPNMQTINSADGFAAALAALWATAAKK